MLKRLLLTVCVLTATKLSFAASPEWPQFLGPDRNGISAEKGLLTDWPSDGPKEKWRVKGGVGMSGIVVSRGKALTMVNLDGKQQLLALSADNGERIWSTPIAPAYRNRMGDGPRATPSVVGDQVFVFTGEGILAAVSFDKGELLWSHDVPAELKVEPAEYGMACSPIVVGNNVVATGGDPAGTLSAYDMKTGKPAWKSGEDPAGYSSPALLTIGGKKQIVAFSGASVLGLSPSDGKLLWRFPYETEYNCNTATPVAYKDQVFVSSGENHGSTLLKLSSNGDNIDVTEAWSSLGPKSVLRSEWQTTIVLSDYLYGFDNVGSAGPVTHLTCVHAPTGKRAWQQTRFGKGNFIAADGKLWIVTYDGELVVVKASPEKYEELGRKPLLGKTRTAPALAGGLLYLRDDKEIVCLEVGEK